MIMGTLPAEGPIPLVIEHVTCNLVVSTGIKQKRSSEPHPSMCIIKSNNQLLEQPASLRLTDVALLPHFLVQVSPCHVLHGNAQVLGSQEHLLQGHNEGMPAPKQVRFSFDGC